jgi:dTDP-4-amino-4,6-dideoxygalactose transaminase
MSKIDHIPALNLQAQISPIRGEIDAAIARSLDNCSFCLGPDVDAFEEEFAQYLGVNQVVGCNSGTSALHLAMRALGIGPGDEVIVPPMTFIATGWAVSYVGATPVFVDIDPRNYCLDPTQLEAAITKKTKAVVPVHLYGHPAAMTPILAICRNRGIFIIEDAAQSHGATYEGQMAGSFGDISCFSFYPSKNLGACGEGGALATSDPAIANHVKALRNHGSTRRYYHDEVGFNYRLEGIQAAILRVKLSHLDRWGAQRAAIADEYSKRLTGLPLQLPAIDDNVTSAWHQYVVSHPRRDELAAHLQKHGIGSGLHYPVPLHLQACYASLGHTAGDFPVAETLANECLSLPMFAELTPGQIDRIVTAVAAFFAE